MIPVTQKQRDNALYARDVMWPRVPPEAVAHDLSVWSCGTAACFGGHVTYDPFFQGQGVRPCFRGAPALPSQGKHGPFGVAKFLFGGEDVFEARDESDADNDFAAGTDHELVTHRLNWLIENSEVVDG